MRLAFVDITYGYAADRPEAVEALGGTTSAVCFLARELVKTGVDCSFFNKIDAPRTVHGIPALPLQALADAVHDPSYSAFIFCGRWMEDMVRLIKGSTKAPLIAWMHESTFNPKLVPMLDEFNAIAFVSEWQQRINQPFVKPHWKQIVARNAMNPLAANMFSPAEKICDAKIKPPILFYAGSFPRGAFHLPKVLERLRAAQSDFSVEVFCNINPSNHEESDAKYIAWMRSLPGITHVGMVGQTELVRRMKTAAFMMAPNPWPETSCIAMIECMAAGLSVITTNRAALPETTSGFARQVAIEDADHSLRFDAPIDYVKFAAVVDEAMREWVQQPDVTEQKLRKQVDYFNAHYQWSQRVAPWVEFVKSL